MSGEIYGRMAAVMAAIGHIGKDKRNTQGQGFNYRGIDDVYNAIHNAMAQHQVFCTMDVLDHKAIERQFKNSSGYQVYTTVRYTFHAPDGSSVSSTVIGEAMDSGDKATNKTYAIAHKYALLQAFMIPTEMPDPDAEVYELQRRDSGTVEAIMTIETLADLQAAYKAMPTDQRKVYAADFTERKKQLTTEQKEAA
jgi:tryptophan 2,3-dioxygenase